MTRAECRGTPRPCPYVSCRHHLYVDVTDTGGIKFNFPDLPLEELSPSCVLDVVESQGPLNCGEIGDLLNMTREGARQALRFALQSNRALLDG